jgi:hypothetical protein
VIHRFPRENRKCGRRSESIEASVTPKHAPHRTRRTHSTMWRSQRRWLVDPDRNTVFSNASTNCWHFYEHCGIIFPNVDGAPALNRDDLPSEFGVGRPVVGRRRTASSKSSTFPTSRPAQPSHGGGRIVTVGSLICRLAQSREAARIYRDRARCWLERWTRP